MILWTLKNAASAWTHCPDGVDEAEHAGYLLEQGIMPAGATWEIVDKPPAPSLAEVRASAVTAIKAEAGRLILARYPQHAQANMTARAVELLQDGIKAGAEHDAIAAAWAWVKAVRAESNRLETAILAATNPAAVAAVVTEWPG